MCFFHMKSRYLDDGEVARLRRSMDAQAWLIFRTMLETGLRVGDVVTLRREHITSDGILYKASKTGKGGVAEITPGLRRALLRQGAGYLFKGRTPGTHLTRQAVWKRIKKAGERSGVDLEGLSPHAMRKAFAVDLYKEKGFAAVKEALQHSYNSTTEIYAFADWNTGANADLPLKRRDLELIVRAVIEALSDRLV